MKRVNPFQCPLFVRRSIISFFILWVLQLQAAKAQLQADIRFDSCIGYTVAVPELIESAIMRPQMAGKWIDPQPIDREFRNWLLPYLQKTAGGQIKLSLLIFPDGRSCMYRVQPNTNVRPDYRLLKKQVEQIRWSPGYQNNLAVVTTKVLQINFSGKSIDVVELQ